MAAWPGIGTRVYSAADALGIPLEVQRYATAGVGQVVESVGKVRRRSTADQLRAKYPGLVLPATIRESIALAEAPHRAGTAAAGAYEPGPARKK